MGHSLLLRPALISWRVRVHVRRMVHSPMFPGAAEVHLLTKLSTNVVGDEEFARQLERKFLQKQPPPQPQ